MTTAVFSASSIKVPLHSNKKTSCSINIQRACVRLSSILIMLAKNLKVCVFKTENYVSIEGVFLIILVLTFGLN